MANLFHSCAKCGTQYPKVLKLCPQCKNKTSDTTVDRAVLARHRNTGSKLASLKRTECDCRMLLGMLQNADRFANRIKARDKNTDVEALIKKIEKRRDDAGDKLEKAIIAAAKTTTNTAKPVRSLFRYYEIDKFHASWLDRFPHTATEASDCSETTGIAQTRYLVPERYLELPDDNDTTWNYTTSFWDVPGSYFSLMYEHWMRDQTHWYSFDSIDLMWVISHYGFGFPKPECDGTLHYEANLQLITSARVEADTGGLLLVDLMLHEQTTGGAAPATFETYQTRIGQQSFLSTKFQSDPYIVGGSMRVKAGVEGRLWFGLATLVSAKDGIAGTNGWSYLMVKPPINADVPGIRYRIVPD